MCMYVSPMSKIKVIVEFNILEEPYIDIGALVFV